MSSTAVLLKPGIDAPPFFITPGLGGSTMELQKVVERIKTRRPIYGLQLTACDNADASKESVETIAQYYLNAISKLQPCGPYAVAGYSFGGIAMVEVARRFLQQGEKIALLALMDTYPHVRYWPLRSWMQVLIRRAIYHSSAMGSMSSREIIQYGAKQYANFVDHLRSRSGKRPLHRKSESPIDSPVSAEIRRAGQVAAVAWAKYHPHYYAGKITFLKAEFETRFPTDAVKLWGQLAQQIEVHKIPGDHRALISAYSDAVAETLSLCLQTAFE
jgi:acetoacetyl-CoA synthetase